MASPPFLPDETKPGASDLVSLFPTAEQAFRDIIESWLLIEHNTNGTHKQLTLDDIATPTIASNLVGIWHESGVLKTRFAGGSVVNLLTASTGLQLSGGTMTGDLVLAGVPDADLKAATKKYVDDTGSGNLASPSFSGNPTAPTPAAGDNDTTLATTAFVQTAVALTRYNAIATTSGTTHDFTGIPAGTNRITILLGDVSTNGTGELLIRIGDSGGVENSNYNSLVTEASNSDGDTTGFIIALTQQAASAYSGIITLARINGNKWVQSGNMHTGSGAGTGLRVSAGLKTLSGTLTTVQLTTTTGNTFDAGEISAISEI